MKGSSLSQSSRINEIVECLLSFMLVEMLIPNHAYLLRVKLVVPPPIKHARKVFKLLKPCVDRTNIYPHSKNVKTTWFIDNNVWLGYFKSIWVSNFVCFDMILNQVTWVKITFYLIFNWTNWINLSLVTMELLLILSLRSSFKTYNK